MRYAALNVTILLCLVAACAAIDYPELSLYIITAVIGSWLLPGLWRAFKSLREIRVEF